MCETCFLTYSVVSLINADHYVDIRFAFARGYAFIRRTSNFVVAEHMRDPVCAIVFWVIAMRTNLENTLPQKLMQGQRQSGDPRFDPDLPV